MTARRIAHTAPIFSDRGVLRNRTYKNISVNNYIEKKYLIMIAIIYIKICLCLCRFLW